MAPEITKEGEEILNTYGKPDTALGYCKDRVPRCADHTDPGGWYLSGGHHGNYTALCGYREPIKGGNLSMVPMALGIGEGSVIMQGMANRKRLIEAVEKG